MKNGGWGYGGGLNAGKSIPCSGEFWGKAFACLRAAAKLSPQDTTKHIRLWYVLWYAKTKKRPEGASLLAVWRKRRDSNPR